MFYLMIGYIILAYQIIKWAVYELFTNGESDSMTCLVGKTAIVTGGNSGIGYAISTMLASRGCRVIIADVVDAEISINSIIEKTSNKNVTSKHLDLGSLKSVRRFSEEITKEEEKIDILVNNAGINFTAIKITEDGLNHVMQVNIFGSFLLTHLLIERLKAAKKARVIFTGSTMAFLSRLTLDNMKDRLNPLEYEPDASTGFMLYKNSKLCNILMAQEFAKKLYKYGITVNSSDPGFVRTQIIYTPHQLFTGITGVIIRKIKFIYIASQIFGQGPFKGARTSFHLASKENLKETGQHFHNCRVFDKPKILYDKKFCNEIWGRTEELVKLKPEEKL